MDEPTSLQSKAKVIVITPEGRVVSMSKIEASKQIDRPESKSLDGIPGYKLGLVHDIADLKPYNKLATMINKSLWREFIIVESAGDMYGNCYIYDDEKDMTSKVWDLVRREVRCKKAKKPHPGIETRICALKEELNDPSLSKDLRHVVELDLANATDYGRVYK